MASGCFPFKRLPWTPSYSGPTSVEIDPRSPPRRLFRSKSDNDVKKSSYKLMTSLSEMDVRRSSDRRQSNPCSARRYRRVLRDVAPSGGFLDDNPNVVRKFSKEYLEKHNIDKASADQFGSRKELPYEVTGTTILKKPLVSESGVRTTAANRPTISFGNEVEVIEFDKKEKVKVKSSSMRRVQLSMDEDVRCIVDETENDPEKENCQSETSPGNKEVLKQWE